ncbi:hypothetical protein B0T24DRAFT_614121 [Lasiosphaeria ovina]|uniref:Uncharacterized protein n=1 Tax=Lasiosphaeria ovina TaxID=92902 RepID=A0AAE0NEM6_9PEZI|nr:hypothetical protein B0T24DRAFT_614121 [Lasiosphaeria ovina]
MEGVLVVRGCLSGKVFAATLALQPRGEADGTTPRLGAFAHDNRLSPPRQLPPKEASNVAQSPPRHLFSPHSNRRDVTKVPEVGTQLVPR